MEGLVQKTFLRATPLHVGQAKLFHRFTWSTLGRASQNFKAITQPTNHLHIIISHIIIIQSNAVAHTTHMTHPQCNIISFTGINSYLSNQACVEKHRTFRAPFHPSDLPPNT